MSLYLGHLIELVVGPVTETKHGELHLLDVVFTCDTKHDNSRRKRKGTNGRMGTLAVVGEHEIVEFSSVVRRVALAVGTNNKDDERLLRKLLLKQLGN